MYFTRQNQGKIDALYSGRFAYILSNDKSTAKKYFEEILRGKETGSEQLLEEYNHFKLYSKSISALYINGIRWIIRFIFIFTNNYWIVYEYYKARAIFFGMAYSFHEDSVREKRVNYIDLIKLDIKIIFHSLKNSKIYMLLFLFFPVIALIGFVITKHFSVRIVDLSCKEIPKKMVVISKYGYVRYEEGMMSSTFVQKFGGIIQLERWGVAHKKEEFWLIAKFAAEKDMWSLYPSKFKFADDDTYFDYVHKIIIFIEKWHGGTNVNPERLKYLKKLFLDPTMQNYKQLKNKLDGISH
ncbi:MAG: hypothetical protein ACTFAL_01910 [Candidatus Electronema sp. V4]|uniref:hypothetical protein n=1 Tax=Candidatus Electronema sp. V4 TaxID=3454756 RepID=UPI0040558A81